MDKQLTTQILHGDSAKLLQRFPDRYFDLCVTSPPYQKNRQSKDYYAAYDFETIADELTRTIKDGGVICWNEGDLCSGGSETLIPWRHATYFKEECGLLLWDTIIFSKNSFSFPSNGPRYHQTWEPVFVFSKGKPKIWNPLTKRNKFLGKRGASGRDKKGKRRTGSSEVSSPVGKRGNVWGPYKIGKHHSARRDPWGHECPAIMHYMLAHDLIYSWSDGSSIVIDPFAGGGTTAIECMLLNRRFVGIEISEKFVDISKERVEYYCNKTK